MKKNTWQLLLTGLLIWLASYGWLTTPRAGRLAELELDLLAHRFNLRGPRPVPSGVLIIGYNASDDADPDFVRKLGEVTRLALEAGCKSIALDRTVETPRDDFSSQLGDLDTSRLVLVCRESGEGIPVETVPKQPCEIQLAEGIRVPEVRALALPTPALLGKAGAVGAADLMAPSALEVWKLPFVVKQKAGPRRFVEETAEEGKRRKIERTPSLLVPGLPVALLAAGQPIARLEVSAGKAKLGEGRVIPLNKESEFAINYYGPGESLPQVAFSDVLDGRVPPERLQGQLCLIGATDLALGDVVWNPFSGACAGPEIMMTAAANLMEGRVARVLSPRSAALTALAYTLLLLGVFFLFDGLFMPLALGLASWLFALMLSELVFVRGDLIVPMVSLLSYGLVLFIALAGFRGWELSRERQQLARALELYVPLTSSQDLAQLNEPLGLGERRIITVMFCDLRHFTANTASMAPEETVSFLNRYFTEMARLVNTHFGIVDKFIGDGFMAVFGAPLVDTEHRRHALQCSLSVLAELPKLAFEYAGTPLGELEVAIGLDTGEALVGRIGSPTLHQFTVIGSPANLAAHLQQAAGKANLPLLASARVLEGLEQEYDTELFAEAEVEDELQCACFQVKGRTKAPGKED